MEDYRITQLDITGSCSKHWSDRALEIHSFGRLAIATKDRRFYAIAVEGDGGGLMVLKTTDPHLDSSGRFKL